MEMHFIFTVCQLCRACVYTVFLSLLGRGDSTADEGTCWLWTKEWWRNGCQNLRYFFSVCVAKSNTKKHIPVISMQHGLCCLCLPHTQTNTLFEVLCLVCYQIMVSSFSNMNSHWNVTATKGEAWCSSSNSNNNNKGTDEIFLCDRMRTNLSSPLSEVNL